MKIEKKMSADTTRARRASRARTRVVEISSNNENTFLNFEKKATILKVH